MSNKDPKIGEKKGFHLPHIFIILFGIVLVCAILTWIIPAGNFDRVDVDGREVVVPGTWHEVDASPVGFLTFFQSFFNGMVNAGEIVFSSYSSPSRPPAFIIRSGAFDGLVSFP